MKRILFLTLALVLLAPVLHAQSYNISWFKVAGGGGTSAGGNYQMSGTIGQPEAGGPMTGGGFSLTGGYWSIISAVQTPGTPNLTISYSGNTVVISWPATGAYTLQQNTNLASSGSWVNGSYLTHSNNGTNTVLITPPAGNLFFRLANP